VDWLAKNPEGKAGEFFRYWDYKIDLKEKAVCATCSPYAM